MKIGDQIEVPFTLSAGTITIPCVVTDGRTSFGRVEWEIAPLSGEGSAWVTEVKLASGQGPVVGSGNWQSTHNKDQQSQKKKVSK